MFNLFYTIFEPIMKIYTKIIVSLCLLITVPNLASHSHKYDTRSKSTSQQPSRQIRKSTTIHRVYFKPDPQGPSVECKSSNHPAVIENWNEHNACVHLVHKNETSFVRIYFDENVDRGNAWEESRFRYHYLKYKGNAGWLFNFTSDVWLHMKETYGAFGSDPELYLVIHGESRPVSKPYCHFSQFIADAPIKQTDENRNILDLSLSKEVSSSNGPTSADMDTLINELFPFVKEKFQGRLWPQSFEDSKNRLDLYTSWRDIFTIYVYNNLTQYNDAERYLKNIKKIQNLNLNPTETNHWFTHWLHPIYTNYSASAFRSYFYLLEAHTAIMNTKSNYKLNIGEFVLFWSAAARKDLREFAHNAFGWNIIFQKQFLDGKLKFSDLKEKFNETDFNFTDESSSSKPLDFEENPIKPERTKEPEPKEVRIYFIIGGSVGAFIIVILVLVLILSFVFYKRRIQYLQTEIRSLSTDEVKEFFEGDLKLKSDDVQALVLSMPFIKDFEIPREQMVLDNNKVLGSGQFGTVIHGFIRSGENNELLPVAMKTVKPNIDIVCFKAFLSEVKIMAYLGEHENIVRLLGTCTANIQNREIYIALEFCPLGNLEDYLKNIRENHQFQNTFNNGTNSSDIPLQILTQPNMGSDMSAEVTTWDLVQWSYQVSNAMKYLTQKKVIHGDLAARNILLTENRIAKISDFGLSRQFVNYANYMKTSKIPVPWRWLAVESLKEMKFSTASDVWAFGVTMWEIFSLGEPPYGAWTYDLFFVDRLIAGDRLQMPSQANQAIYKIMKDCWEVEPSQRPTFQQIHIRLGKYLSKP